MKEHTRKLLDKAIDAIEAAEILVDHEKPDVAAGRAYYAMFYIAEALLNEKLFNQVEIDAEVHTLVWPNGADFDPFTGLAEHVTEMKKMAEQWGKVNAQ